MAGLFTLDLATSTGFAFWQPGSERVYSGSFQLRRTGKNVGAFLADFKDKAGELLEVHRPDLCVFEAPFVDSTKHQDTARKLLSLAGFTEYLCLTLGIEALEANNKSVKRHFIGHGNLPRKESKLRCIQACRQRGWEPGNDDEADALALLDYSAHIKRLDVPWNCGGLFKTETAA